MMPFSKWPVHSPSSGLRYVPVARNLTFASCHMVPHRSVLFSASNYYWMCHALKMDMAGAFTLLFSR